MAIAIALPVRVMVTFGTRADATKMAPLVLELLSRPDQFTTKVCVTAQHRQMLDQVLHAFDLHPDYDLDLMRERQSLSSLTQRILEAFEPVLKEEKPEILLVHGDTLTTFAAALVAFYEQIPIGHVEAGLRTYDRYSPFPEEMNRQLAARLADYHFAPTIANKENLVAERIAEENIFITGNTAIDAVQTTVQENFIFEDPKIAELISSGRKIITVTAHRRENLGAPLAEICWGIRDIVAQHPEVAICYAVHLNPAVREVVWPILADQERIALVEPPDIVAMHNLMARSFIVLSDSGGLQEEAPALGKPVLVLRDVTERQEAVIAGTVRLVGPHREAIARETTRLISDSEAYAVMASAKNPFGDGRASWRIAEALLYLKGLRDNPPPEFGI